MNITHNSHLFDELEHTRNQLTIISALTSDKDPSDEELASAQDALDRWKRNEDRENNMLIFVRANTEKLRAMTIPDPIILSEGHLSRYSLMLSNCTYNPTIPNLRAGIRNRLTIQDDASEYPPLSNTPFVRNAVMLYRNPSGSGVGLAYINLNQLLLFETIMGNASFVDQIATLASITEPQGI